MTEASVANQKEIVEVPGFPGVFVDRDGEVYRSSKYGELKPCKWFYSPNGYRIIYVNRDDVRVHHLVLTAFVGPRPEGQCGRHLNDVRTDNRLVNLAWGTPKQNTDDARRNGRFNPHGENNGSAKLTHAEIESIRGRYAAGECQRRIAECYGISFSQMSQICRGSGWKDPAYKPPVKKKKLTQEQHIEVNRLFRSGEKNSIELADFFGVTISTIRYAVRKDCRRKTEVSQ